MRTDQLIWLLTSALANRADRGHPIMISLVHDTPVLFGYHGPDPTSLDVTFADLLAGESPWQPVGRISRLLDRTLDGYDDCEAEGVLPFLAVHAATWTARFAEQTGAKLNLSLNLDAIDARFASGHEACVKNVRRLQHVSSSLTDAMMKWLTCQRSGCAPEGAVMLRLMAGKVAVPAASRRCRTIATWLAADGKELGRETLEELQTRMSSSSEIAELLATAKELQAQQEQHRALGDEILHAMSKELARAVEEARAEGGCVGYRMFSTETRGMPAEVCLFIDGGVRGYAGAHLVARRAHHEFILESAQHKLFYFPPIQLVAIIEFGASSPPWHLAIPRIRMPSNHPPWVHPYSGRLDCDRFARARLLGSGREAMVPPSEKAKRLFPALTRRLIGEPGVSDLCLDGLRARLKQLARRAESQGSEPDVLGLVQNLWGLVHQGLTRAHQRNLETPRVSMEGDRMCYRIASRASLAGTSLAKRISRYDPV